MVSNKVDLTECDTDNSSGRETNMLPSANRGPEFKSKLESLYNSSNYQLYIFNLDTVATSNVPVSTDQLIRLLQNVETLANLQRVENKALEQSVPVHVSRNVAPVQIASSQNVVPERENDSAAGNAPPIHACQAQPPYPHYGMGYPQVQVYPYHGYHPPFPPPNGPPPPQAVVTVPQQNGPPKVNYIYFNC